MAISFKSLGHFFATAFKAISAELPKLAATKTIVEGVTIAAGGAALVPVEDAAYALLGAFAAAFSASGSAVSAKLQDAGLDVVAVQKAEAVLAQVPQLVSVAKAIKVA